MNNLIAACGLDCSQCEAYLATQADDEAAKQTVLEKWSQLYGPMSIDNITCDGCMVLNARHGGYCADCPVRACSLERSLPNCAVCSDYPCDKIGVFISQDPGVKERLDRMRRN